ncbi:FAD/NAD(P)-binding domain-containing protein [Hypoxylon sp. FL0543]|nr:FAD/NAD(P)-binding domain-containing protein [Hypoxylon sp. FL0543]
MPLKVLIIGAGICGPAFATMLRRSDPESNITVLERHPGIRHNGLQIDLRAWGVPIMKRMGLLDEASKRCVRENGAAIVDSKGRIYGQFGVNASHTGQQSLTSEFEIMRGDLVEVLYEASLKDPKTGVSGEAESEDAAGVRYRFGTWATALSQDEKGVDVTLSDGSTKRYDLVVGADGQWSRTRRMIFGEEAGLDMFKRLNVYAAYYTIPRLPGDDDVARFFHAGKGRGVAVRSGDRPETQVYLMVRTASEEVRRAVERQPAERQKAVFERLFADAGWQTPRFLAGLRESTDFYADSLGQVKAPHVARGRVALLGDAAYCAAPVSGMGTTVSLVGAWVLAGELARHGGDVRAALAAYDANVRPYIVAAQKLVFGIPWGMTIESTWAVVLVRLFIAFLSLIRIDKILFAILPEDKGGIKIPEYPETGM